MRFDPETTTVGELVVERPARARAFERLGIDYCCGGKLPLAEACRKRGLDPHGVVEALDAVEERQSADRDWSTSPLAELADHIEQTHHAYLREELPRLSAMTKKVAAVHGDTHAGLKELADVFESFAYGLASHMEKEERVLFPMIRVLEQGGPAGGPGIDAPVAAMEEEHDEAGQALQAMRRLTDGFTPPRDACNTYRAMLDGLAQLKADMHAHVHKENNILFPRAQRLAKQSLGV